MMMGAAATTGNRRTHAVAGETRKEKQHVFPFLSSRSGGRKQGEKQTEARTGSEKLSKAARPQSHERTPSLSARPRLKLACHAA